MVSQCMRFTRLLASTGIKMASAFFFVSRYNIFVSRACLYLLRRLLRFPFVWRYIACVSYACVHRLKQLLRFPWNGVKVRVFHSRLCIDEDGFCGFLGMVSQCMRFTRLSESFKTASAFLFVWRYNECV